MLNIEKNLKMDSAALQTNLNSLKEMILDESKLVTYVSLSKELCIHVNDSKYLLGEFVEDIKQKRPTEELNINYIISGLAGDNKARTTVCTEIELHSVRKSFKIVFFEHIYSISKGVPSLDNVAFMSVNKFEDFPLCTGLIRSNFCTKRTSDEIGNLKSNSQDIVFNNQKDKKPVEPPQKKVKVEPDNGNKNNAESKGVVKVHESKSDPIIKTEKVSPKKEVYNSKPVDTKKNNVKTQKGIAGFFSKSNSTPFKKSTEIKENGQTTSKTVPVKKEKEPIKESPKKDVEEMEVDVINGPEEIKEEPKKEAKPKAKKEAEPKNNTKNKSLTQIKKNAKVDKKRKRVLHVSDSESDDEKNDPFSDEPAALPESDDEIPPTPTVNTVKITSGIINPKKRRKIVDKTYTDEDGYILTKKEEIYESCSDNDEDTNTKENVKIVNQVKTEYSPPVKKNEKNNKKKVSPPQKGKQATLMNFFKKV